MKFLCTGDQHFDERSWLGPEWLGEQERVWQSIVDLAIAEEVDAVLHAGDVFQHRRPTPAELRAFQRPLYDLFRHGIDTLVIAGNHDVSAADYPSALELFSEHADVHREPGIWRGNVATLPWTPIGRLIAAQNGGDRDALNAQAADLLVDTARGLREQVSEPAILMLHWSVSGSALPNGLPVDQLREPVLPVTELEEQGWDAVVCGHIHKAQLMGSEDARGPLFYVGSPMPLNFGEGGDDHGCWILDYADAVSPARFVPLDGPRFVTIDDFTAHDLEWWTDAIKHDRGLDLVLPPVVGAIVRIRYQATAEEAARIDQREIREALLDAGAWKVVVQPQIVREERARVEGMDESMGELEAVAAWADANGIDEAATSDLVHATKAYLEAVR